LSLSCGVAAYTPGKRIDDLIKAADADLYVKKASLAKPAAAVP
jgi:PleD family two-component response regulator